MIILLKQQQIPFDNFICTNAGTIVESVSSPGAPSSTSDSGSVSILGSKLPSSPSPSAVKMTKDRIKTIGVSLLGSPENDGEFELAVDEFWAVNKVSDSEWRLSHVVDDMLIRCTVGGYP
jgi:hypothetical protein